MKRIKNEWIEFKLLIKSVPSTVVIVFAMAVLAMNLLANKSIDLNVSWLALDCGFIVSWLTFLAMDMITKRFGPKAATEISIFAIVINLLFCLILYAGSKIPGTWSESYVAGSEYAINGALDNTFGGTWYVVLGSTVAFVVSSIVNNFTNWGIGKLFVKNPSGAIAYFTRSYVSTAIGQFVDNLLFALIVSHIFFGWTFLQCITCSITGMIAELLCEVIFSYFGYKVTSMWEKNKVGEEYLAYIRSKNESSNNRNL